MTTSFRFKRGRRRCRSVAGVDRKRSSILGAAVAGGLLAMVTAAGICVAIFSVLLHAAAASSAASGCATAADGGGAMQLLPGGGGTTVGATEYGGPGDPTSGTVGSSGVDLLTHTDSYAELGGLDFQTATAMGGLPYGTPLRITAGGHSVIAYKRDIGLGGGPIDGYPRVIDLWWELAQALGLPYDGDWAGAVKIERPPSTGSATLLGDDAGAAGVAGDGTATGTDDGAGVCDSDSGNGGTSVAVTSGPRAALLSDGEAAAPADAPAAVKGIIAAGNQIVGKPYVYGGGHGTPLAEIAPAYDCSSSVEHLLYGGALLPDDYEADSGTLESWGLPGPGRWVTIYASADHVFMYVAGLRWDTHNAAGPDDGSSGIGWHPLVREADGFVVRHPAGL